MEKIKDWLRLSPLYFWFVLVIWQSIVGITTFHGLWNKMMDIAIWAVLFTLINWGILWSGYFPQFAYNWNVLIFYTIVLLGARILQGLLSIPPRLYFDAKTCADKFTWNDVGITINKSDIPYSVCLKVSNNKPFDVQDANGVITNLQKGTKIILTGNSGDPKRVLFWVKDAGDTSNPKKLSKRGDSASARFLAIATFNGNDKKAWLRVADNATGHGNDEKIPLDIDVSYRIRINFLGQVDGRKMDEYCRDYWLAFDGSELRMEEIK